MPAFHIVVNQVKKYFHRGDNISTVVETFPHLRTLVGAYVCALTCSRRCVRTRGCAYVCVDPYACVGARACALAGVCVRSCVRAYVRACGGLAPVSRTGRTAPCGVVIMIIPNLIRLACILLTI